MTQEMTLPEQMLRFRAVHNISQGTFAKMCNLSVQTVCSIENGLQTPSKLTAQKIIMTMEGVSMNEDQCDKTKDI